MSNWDNIRGDICEISILLNNAVCKTVGTSKLNQQQKNEIKKRMTKYGLKKIAIEIYKSNNREETAEKIAKKILSGLFYFKGGVATFLPKLLSILILFGALGYVGYYYFMKHKKNTKEVVETPASLSSIETHKEGEVNSKQLDELIKQLGIKNNQIKMLQEENTILKKQASSVVQELNYVIKPKNKLVAECYSAPVGQWHIPKECAKTLISNVETMLKEDKKIVALEVNGIVNELQYSGFSPELKQEGLASFRARSVIEYLKKSLPGIAVFEGLSIQKSNKRGYIIKAYYIQ